MNKSKSRDIVLVLTNDHSLAAAKTSRHLSTALDRLGARAIVRDTGLIRWAIGQLDNEFVSRRDPYELLVIGKWFKFLPDYGIAKVVSLDLHWLFTSHLFLEQENLSSIHSFWFDDLRSHLKSSAMFPLSKTPLEMINHEKVSHYCYGAGQAEEMRLLGVNRVIPSPLAAPAEYLKAKFPCTVRNRLAFIGNPGLSSPPGAETVAAMNRMEPLVALRRLARNEVLSSIDLNEIPWLAEAPPELRDLLATAMEMRVDHPFRGALDILQSLRKTFPQSFEFINRSGRILDCALLIKTVQRYDRPGLVHRLWRRGILDVFGTPEQWALFGVKAHPSISFPQLPEIYQTYAAHLNASNCARDATANEKLFEIAACGRVSLNLDSPDVRAAYPNGEVILAENEEALEGAAEQMIREPDKAFAMGELARKRTAKQHLWDHRLQGVLK